MKNIILPGILIAVFLSVSILIYRTETAPVFTKGDAKLINTEPDPLQSSDSLITIAPMQIGKARFFLTPQAKYTINGMLVSKRRYYRGDMSRFSPYDYALVWGKIPDLLPHLKFSQTFRFCLFQIKSSATVDLNYVQTHMSNNHLIPANNNIRKAFKHARKKDLVQISGYLVDVVGSVKSKTPGNWKTSTNRVDTWGGACEIIYVTRLQIADKIYK